MVALLKRAVIGLVPTYFAHIPLRLIRPYDKVYLAQQRHPHGDQEVHNRTLLINPDKPPVAWVYPKTWGFVLPADYLVYEAYRDAEVEYVPCYVLAARPSPSWKFTRGPLSVEEITAARGISMVQDDRP